MVRNTVDSDITVLLLPLNSISRSPVNPRIIREDDPKVMELAKNIERVGLIQPITVRPVENGYEIIVGERRWRAYCKLYDEGKIEHILAFIRELNDEDAHELTVTENLQREDLSPIEEANGIRTLIENKRSIEEIAERLGKPLGWVVKRANLVKLTQKWREAIADPNHIYSQWNVGLLEIVSRYDASVQDEIFARYSNHEMGCPAVKSLQNEMARFARKISSAPWSLKTEDALTSCLGCAKRSGAQRDLFGEDEEVGKKDHCLDPKCWNKKMLTYLDAKDGQLKELHPNMIYVSNAAYYQRELPDDSRFNDLTTPRHKLIPAKKGSEGSIPALIVDGPGMGTLQWYKKTDYTGGSVRLDASGNKMPKSMDERRKALEKRRDKALLERAKELVQEEIDKPKKIAQLSLLSAMRFLRASELPWPWDFDKDGRKNIGEMAGYIGGPETDSMEELKALRTQLLRRALLQLISNIQGSINGSYKPDAAELVYWLFGLDLEKAKDEIREEIPESKGWANLNEDGTKKKAK